MIHIDHVTKEFGNKKAVSDLILTVAEGEVFGFLGPNGAGKTTTMKMILGLLSPTQGSISLFGEPAGSMSVRKRIGFLPEFAHFYKHLSGREFLEFMGEIFGQGKDERQQRAQELMEHVHLPEEAHDRNVGTYSKGMKQRIGMAQSLINDPEILFLDEPMSGLDPIGRREMRNIILSLKKQGKTIVFNSHILSDVEQICDRIGILHQGELRVCGTLADVVPANKTLEDVFITTVSE